MLRLACPNELILMSSLKTTTTENLCAMPGFAIFDERWGTHEAVEMLRGKGGVCPSVGRS
jgi:hypothetical protein